VNSRVIIKDRDLFLRNINDMHKAVAASETEQTIICSYKTANLCIYTRQGRSVHVNRVSPASTLKNEK
jgi:hypothetical protein